MDYMLVFALGTFVGGLGATVTFFMVITNNDFQEGLIQGRAQAKLPKIKHKMIYNVENQTANEMRGSN